MNSFVEAFLWGAVQITLFSLIAWVTYSLLVRRFRDLALSAVFFSIVIVGVLTISLATPDLRWSWGWPWGGEELAQVIPTAINGTNDYEANLLSKSLPFEISEAEDPAALVSSYESTADEPIVMAQTPLRNAVSWQWVLFAFAGIVIGYGIVRFVLSLVWLQVYRSLCKTLDDQWLCQTTAEMATKLGLAHSPPICELSTISSPATIGWWKPLVLLPENWREWTNDQTLAVLAHELAHVKAGHYLQWLVGQTVLTFNFYHPLIHGLVGRLGLEQEIVADHQAATLLGSREKYAAALASIALSPANERRTRLAPGLFMSKSSILRRIAMLRKQSIQAPVRSRIKQNTILIALALIGLGVSGIREVVPSVSANEADIKNPAQFISSAFDEQTPTQEGADAKLLNSKCKVTALFRVYSTSRSLLDEKSESFDKEQWQIIRATHISLMRSNIVLGAAIRNPKLKALPVVIAHKTHLEDWLSKILVTEFVGDSEILQVSVLCELSESEQYQAIVQAVVEAFNDQVLYAVSKKKRHTRDVLGHTLRLNREEIRRKLESYDALSTELGKSQGDSVIQQLNMNRLTRIEDEILRLEGEQLINDLQEAKPEQTKFQKKYFSMRIDQLNERREELEQKMSSAAEQSAELTIRKEELTQLQQVATEIALRIERWDIENNAPSQVQLIQTASVTLVGHE